MLWYYVATVEEADVHEGEQAVRAIAFYLPQYHPISENDDWWGKDFTDWVNVKKARPLFRGHYQPHVPADLGYYDLRDHSARQAQADLASRYGIHGFCYYHYWFNGRRLLEQPIDAVLNSGKPDFPFCLCWANENWTRRWDGLEKEVLIAQDYSEQDDLLHIQSLIPYFKDPRYIKINGKPLFLIYRTELMPDPAKTAALWREVAKQAGLEGLYLARVESVFSPQITPESIGFDAAVEFAPDTRVLGRSILQQRIFAPLRRAGLVPKLFIDHWLRTYKSMIRAMLRKPAPPYRRFMGVCPSWDNSARREKGATIFLKSTPALYGQWLRTTVERTMQRFKGDERIVFINAWNEWAEGCHLEPDEHFGHQYLEATGNALIGSGVTPTHDKNPKHLVDTAVSK